MKPHKTERARAALNDRSGGLSAFERRILILSDGQRTTDTLVSLLGADASAGVARLLLAGYLAATPSSARGISRIDVAMGDGASPVDPAAAMRSDAPADASRPDDAASGPGAAATPVQGARRSLAASKMYLIDMLQLQRGAEARSLVATLRCAGDPERLAASLLEALAFLQRSAPASYSRRVLDRVAEILPEEILPALDAQRDPIAAAERTARTGLSPGA